MMVRYCHICRREYFGNRECASGVNCPRWLYGNGSRHRAEAALSRLRERGRFIPMPQRHQMMLAVAPAESVDSWRQDAVVPENNWDYETSSFVSTETPRSGGDWSSMESYWQPVGVEPRQTCPPPRPCQKATRQAKAMIQWKTFSLLLLIDKEAVNEGKTFRK